MTYITPEVIIILNGGVFMNITLTEEQQKYLSSIVSISKEGKPLKNELIKEALDIPNSDVTSVEIEKITDILTYDFDENKKKSQGITFTPIPLVKFMYQNTLKQDVEKLLRASIADIAIGNGAFFIGLIIHIKENNPNFSVVKFIENNLFGYDIEYGNIYFAKLNLSAVALYYGEDVEEIKFNLFEVDTIEHFLNNKFSRKFDLLVGNPPYVKQQNIDKSLRLNLENNFETISSNYNLYYAFIEMNTKLLSDEGRVLLLVPNYILKIKSASELRKYLINSQYFEKIIDFKSYKLFEGIDTYSMVLQLKNKSPKLYFKSLSKDMETIFEINSEPWQSINLNNNNIETINLASPEEQTLIKKVQDQVLELEISTGIATLKDKVYLIDHIEIGSNSKKFYKLFKGCMYQIESDLVMKIIKGSGSSKSAEIKEQYIIYPYEVFFGKVSLIPLEKMERDFPLALNYFKEVYNELLTRSGNYTDFDWYRYGRSQSLDKYIPKIIYPTNTDKPKFRYFNDKALFYNGYAVFGIKNRVLSTREMLLLEIILNSELMEKFMTLTSYFIGGGYVSYQKKYLEKFKIPDLNEDQKDKIFNLNELNDKKLLNKFIYSIYELDYETYGNNMNESSEFSL